MLPLVGISTCIDRGRLVRPGVDYFYVKRAYAERVNEAGAIPLLICADTPVKAVVGVCDAFVMTGGDDLPRSFRETSVDDGANAEDAERIAWDRELLDEAFHRKKPLLGICYGMQLMNLHFGGSLYEKVATERQNTLDHGSPGRTTQHALKLFKPSSLLNGLGPDLVVNSSHRQAVDQPAPGFRVTARASDGVVEAIERDRLWGVEWHPETDAQSSSVYSNFVQLLGRS